MFVVALVLQPTVSASTLLVTTTLTTAADAATGVIGILSICCVMVAFALVLDPRTDSFRAVAVSPQVLTSAHKPPNAAQLLCGAPRRLVLSWMRWVVSVDTIWTARGASRRGNSGEVLFVDQFGFLFESCRKQRHWWLLVDVSQTVVVGALYGMSNSVGNSCAARQVAVLVVSVAVLVAALVLSPNGKPMEAATTAALYAVQVVVAVCNVVGSEEADDAATKIALVTGVAACAQTVVGCVSFVTLRRWWKQEAVRNTHSTQLDTQAFHKPPTLPTHRYHQGRLQRCGGISRVEVQQRAALHRLVLVACAQGAPRYPQQNLSSGDI